MNQPDKLPVREKCPDISGCGLWDSDGSSSDGEDVVSEAKANDAPAEEVTDHGNGLRL